MRRALSPALTDVALLHSTAINCVADMQAQAVLLMDAINWTLSYVSSRTPDELVYLAERRSTWIQQLVQSGVQFTINNDGKYVLKTH